jgi:hypothetical protein
MKTKNNVQKTILRSGAVILSLVLLSFTVAAQGYWKQLLTNNSFTQIASALASHRTSTATLSFKPEAVSYESETPVMTTVEAPLHFEAWMDGNADFWGESALSEQINEQELSLESWMVDADFFQTAESPAENPLQLDGWMVSGNFWK